MSNLEEKSGTVMHSLCQVSVSWLHEKKCRKFVVYKQNIQHFVKEIKLKFRLCLLSFCSCGNLKWPDPKQPPPRWAEASLRSSKSLWSHFSVRVCRTCHSTFSSSQIGRAAAAECFKAIPPPTCLEEWGIWLFPEVEKRCRISLMSWLSVWICTDLRTLVRQKEVKGRRWGAENVLCFISCLNIKIFLYDRIWPLWQFKSTNMNNISTKWWHFIDSPRMIFFKPSN